MPSKEPATDNKELQIYYHPASLEHKLFPKFSEKPARLKQLTTLFNEMSLPVTTPRIASDKEIERAHKDHYIKHVKSISQQGPIRATLRNVFSRYVQWYTRVSKGSYDAALYSAGGVCQAVEDTLSGKNNRAFCAARPPGHHAGPEKGEGFCLFNNVAIGALHALDTGAKRVVVIDFDRHHGNGTQDIIERENNENILFISSYQQGCKYNHNDKEGRVSDNTLTVPVPENSDFATVKHLYETKVIPALYDFKPDLILISAGFDMHKDDPLTNIRLEESDFFTLTKMITAAANDLCNGRVVSALEGGYDLKALKGCVRNHLKALKK